ncbi:MAG: phospholipid carrier-dependent glycosyltransferase [Anaerolineales bacterium]|nr:phospholipid carrier-dependent glycosyltransferase [Anaerolineales bacterium]
MAIKIPKWIFLLALIIRAAPVLAAFNLGIGLDDMHQYDMLGRSLVSGNGYRWYSEPDLDLIRPYITVDLTNVEYDPRGIEAAFRAPMYPIFLSAIYFFGRLAHRFFFARLAQAALNAMLAPMAYVLARRIDPGRERTARIAALIVALYPILALYPLALATENLFFVLALGTVLLILRGAQGNRTTVDGQPAPGLGEWEKPGVRWFILAGAVLGLGILTRSVLAFFLPFAMFWIWKFARSLRGAALFAAAAAAVVFPWALRNSILAGRPAFVEISLGYNLYMGYHPQSSGTFQFGISTDLLSIFNDMDRDTIGTQKAAAFIRDDPGRIPELIVRKAGYFFGLERRAIQYFYSSNFFGYLSPPVLLALAMVILMPFVFLVPSAAFGAAAAPRTDAKILAALFLAAYITPHLLILAEERFHMTLIPFLAVFAAAAIVRRREIFESLRAPNGWRRWALPAAVTILLLFNWGYELWADRAHLSVLLAPGGNESYFPY